MSSGRSEPISGSLPGFLALACVGFLSSPAIAADDQSSVQPDNQRDIVVTGTRDQPKLESPKATSDLIDTPQTVTVISDQTLRRQNLLTLRDALTAIPGITFGAGEGGGGYGDNINLRGYSASNDITVDGVRDSAQYSRTDPFNLQQIEIYNGANSVFNGSGSVGGTINLVSKIPQPRDLTILQAAVGTDNYRRATVDANRRVGDLVGLRLNAMYHHNDYPGRDFEDFERWGVAPAVTFGISGRTDLTIAYVHQQDDNVPLYGIPFFLSQIHDGPLEEADPSDYYGYRNFDRQDIRLDRATATLNHEFEKGLSVRNLSRWQRVAQYSQTSAPQGTFCLAATGRQPVAANSTATQGLPCPANLAPGTWQRSGNPIGLVRDQENRLFHTQTDLRWRAGEAGRLRNTLVVGGSLTWEDYRLETASLARTAGGAAVPFPVDTIADPVSVYAGPVNHTVTARSRGDTSNRALYAFDTLEIGSRFELNGGIRLERARGTFRNLALASYPPGTVPLTALQLLPQSSRETLLSYRAGAVFKPAANASLYVAYGNALTPTSATVRLGCGVIATPGAADPCAADPERARNYEIGAKADVLGKRLQLTAALFRNERSNFRVPSNDPAQPAALQVVDGRSRVDGLALGASGYITPRWSIFANYTYLDSEVLQSVSDFCLANPSAACLNSAAIPDPQRGDRLLQTPKHSGSLFTSYRLRSGLELGYGLTYQGGFATHQRNLLQRTQYFTDGYLVHRLFASYPVSDGVTVQLNVQNVTDELYFTSVRNNVNATSGAITGGWAMPGESRSAVLSLFYSF
ncbi:MAG TPA: TonB-dependent receptor [Allosphingosinicella sp.]|jgi:catecholate siderophore receptor|nr:TonB-dependent receptor [Allosphingosinicella sp.]